MKYILIVTFLIFFSCTNRERDNRIAPVVFEEIIEDIVDMVLEDNITENIMTHYVTVNLRLRDGGNLSDSIITILPQGTNVRIKETGNTETIDGITAPWVKIISETGYVGWCFSGFVSQLNINIQENYNFPVILEIGTWPNFSWRRDPDIIPNVDIIIIPETCTIQNLQEIDNVKINDVFNRPILNKDIMLFYHTRGMRSFGINDLLDPLQIILSEEDEERLFHTNKITMEEISLYFHGSREEDIFFLYVIEYENNSILFDFNIRIGTSRDEITERFGAPTYFSEDRDTYIYFSFSTFRQMNILFNNDRVAKVQLIAFSDH